MSWLAACPRARKASFAWGSIATTARPTTTWEGTRWTSTCSSSSCMSMVIMTGANPTMSTTSTGFIQFYYILTPKFSFQSNLFYISALLPMSVATWDCYWATVYWASITGLWSGLPRASWSNHSWAANKYALPHYLITIPYYTTNVYASREIFGLICNLLCTPTKYFPLPLSKSSVILHYHNSPSLMYN